MHKVGTEPRSVKKCNNLDAGAQNRFATTPYYLYGSFNRYRSTCQQDAQHSFADQKYTTALGISNFPEKCSKLITWKLFARQQMEIFRAIFRNLCHHTVLMSWSSETSYEDS